MSIGECVSKQQWSVQKIVRNNLWKFISKAAYDQIQEQIQEPVLIQVCDIVWDSVWDQVWDQINGTR